ncbi:MAG TPA: alcohol dehydrogenase catalytic domain-containing protein [Methylomirabilota bacterium]|jgi:L-iditol 2-dehydrogenase|nr:alcohol dehydrogenase catalytic domain-containing protein [Methylomirabilota bacterium]
MRAQVFHGPGDLRFEEIPLPDPEPGGLVARVDAALTCGTDVKTLRRGHPVMIPRVPTVFGHELAGVVTAVGHQVRGVKEGDRIVAANSAPCGSCRFCAGGRPNLCEDLLFVNGAYGEHIALPPRLVQRNVVPIGPGLPAPIAAFTEPLACALLGIERGGVGPGMTVAVFGHGPLGCLLAMAARQRGARVIIVGKPGWRLEQVRGMGLGDCLDGPAVGDVAAHLRGLTGGRGPEVTVDATGRPEVWEQAIDGVGRGGAVVLFGGCAPGTSVRVDTRRAHYEELMLVGAFHHTPPMIRRAVELLESKAIDPGALLSRRVGLGQVREALASMERGETMKVLVDPQR